MKLQYPFPSEVRNLYLYNYECWNCGRNGTTSGGLEVHHILGRVSDSAFNSSVLCHECHELVSHSRSEHQFLFSKTARYLHENGFKPSDDDLLFLQQHWEELVDEETKKWFTELPVIE